MDSAFFVKGLIVGLSIAAPVGPIGVLCIRRTLSEGIRVGFLTGLGAATADAVYGFVAGFGLLAVSNVLVGQQNWLRLVGGLFLCCLGMRNFLAEPPENRVPVRRQGLVGAYGSTFFLTLTNPMTIVAFSAVFAGLGVTRADQFSAGVLVLGVFAGSTLWWCVLSGSVNLFRRSLTPSQLRWVNRISGSVVVGFGMLILSGLVL